MMHGTRFVRVVRMRGLRRLNWCQAFPPTVKVHPLAICIFIARGSCFANLDFVHRVDLPYGRSYRVTVTRDATRTWRVGGVKKQLPSDPVSVCLKPGRHGRVRNIFPSGGVPSLIMSDLVPAGWPIMRTDFRGNAVAFLRPR